MTRTAFIDENKRSAYMVCAVTVVDMDLASVRKELQRAKGRRSGIHMKNLNDRERLKLGKLLPDLGVEAYVLSAKGGSDRRSATSRTRTATLQRPTRAAEEPAQTTRTATSGETKGAGKTPATSEPAHGKAPNPSTTSGRSERTTGSASPTGWTTEPKGRYPCGGREVVASWAAPLAKGAPMPRPPYRVAVIDDEPPVIELLATMLRIDGRLALADSYEDASLAINGLADVDLDAVLCDLHMPGIDGLQALPELRKACGSAVIAMYTADPDGAGTAEALGADCVIDKADHADALIDHLVSLIEDKQVGAAKQ